MGAAAPIIGLALTAVSVVHGVKVAKDAAKEQEEIQNQQSAIAAQKRIEEKRAAARRRRITAAKIAQGAENTGTGASSGAIGAIGSVDAQTAAARTGIAVRESGEQAIAESRNNLADLEVDRQIGQGVGQIGSSIFGLGGGSIFSKGE